ncbi:hypothetical protein JWG39_09215 [Desulforhopalus vacuolatus]|uniref:hypothetical protein n=1 Tax=Desulforhopalus vacuolatus TaxID=40414 RepID=UPI001966669F|nr:hypothetical protein [Desulforhopalus vacuolatus]MBM9519995.1 hypothetical protein [Desulforhopalus vacuolatus]
MQRVEQAHNKIHIIAHDMQNKYEKGDIEAAHAALADLELVFDDMNIAVGLCYQPGGH